MAVNVYANITQRGTEAKFREILGAWPTMWDRFTQTVPSDGPDVEHVWLGMLPQPREFLNGRELAAIRDFKYNRVNKEYELTFVIDEKSMEDDRHGFVNSRITDAAQIWAKYKDILFAAAVNSGATAGFTGYDAVTYFNASHVVGAATPDNALTSSAPTDPEALTVAEMKVELTALILALQGMQDDTANEGYNAAAMSEVLIMGNQQFQLPLVETLNSTIVLTKDAGGSVAGVSNPYFENIGEPVINPYLGVTNDYLYAAAVGDKERMPFIFQDRLPLQIRVLTDPASIVNNRGVLVACRARFLITYGEFRRMIRIALT